MMDRTCGALAIAFGFLTAAQDGGLDPLTRNEFRRLHGELQPEAQDWQRIPWRLDLLAARREARELARPLFLWSMNGHPLGCT